MGLSNSKSKYSTRKGDVRGTVNGSDSGSVNFPDPPSDWLKENQDDEAEQDKTNEEDIYQKPWVSWLPPVLQNNQPSNADYEIGMKKYRNNCFRSQMIERRPQQTLVEGYCAGRPHTLP